MSRKILDGFEVGQIPRGGIMNSGWQIVPVPNAAFSFLPFSIERDNRTFRPSANWDVSSKMPTTTATMYVSPSGADANNGSSLVLAKRTLENAIGSMNQATTIWMADGFYGENAPVGTGGWWRGANPVYNLAVRAINSGMVVNSPHVYQLSWLVNDAPTNTYQANYASTVLDVWDGKTLTAEGDYVKFILQTSVVNVQANAGSYYVTGGVIYIHLIDGRAPDSDLHVFRGMTAAYCARDNITIYIEGIEFQGGTNAPAYFRNISAAGGLNVYAKNCKFKYGSATGGFATEGTVETIVQGCIAACNQNDGFNYHSRNTIIPKVIEINCIGRDNGNYAGNDNDNNGSSIHDAGTIVRLMGEYYRSGGPNMVDVNLSYSWVLGSLIHNSVSTASGSQINFSMSGTAWLDRVTSSASTYDLQSLTSSTIYTREIISTGNNLVTGIITTY